MGGPAYMQSVDAHCTSNYRGGEKVERSRAGGEAAVLEGAHMVLIGVGAVCVEGAERGRRCIS